MWTALDLYHGITDKVQFMIAEGKFCGYAYQGKKNLWRGTNQENLSMQTTCSKKSRKWKKRLEFKFEFQVYAQTPSGPVASNMILKVYYFNCSFMVKNDMKESLIIFISPKKKFNFPWEDLHAKQVDLETVLNHYFENCFMRVPMHTLCRFLKVILEVDRAKFLKERYKAIVNSYNGSLAFAMSQHKRLGHSSAFWDLPDSCLALIYGMLWPDFD